MALAQPAAVVFLFRSCPPPLPRPGRSVRPHHRRAAPRRCRKRPPGLARLAAACPALVPAAPHVGAVHPPRGPASGRHAADGRLRPAPPRIATPRAAAAPAAGFRLAPPADAAGRVQRLAIAASPLRPGDGGAHRRRAAGGPHPSPALPDAGRAPHARPEQAASCGAAPPRHARPATPRHAAAAAPSGADAAPEAIRRPPRLLAARSGVTDRASARPYCST